MHLPSAGGNGIYGYLIRWFTANDGSNANLI